MDSTVDVTVVVGEEVSQPEGKSTGHLALPLMHPGVMPFPSSLPLATFESGELVLGS